MEIVADDSLCFKVKVFEAYLIEDHAVYLKYLRTMQNVLVVIIILNLFRDWNLVTKSTVEYQMPWSL